MEKRKWAAWVNAMPSKPAELHVVGEVEFPHPGWHGYLRERVPQGINPTILMLDLVLVEQPGIWPEVMTWRAVGFHKAVAKPDQYAAIDVQFDGKKFEYLDVTIVH